MKKVMISQSIAEKTDEEIIATRIRAIQTLEAKGYEVVNPLFTDDCPSRGMIIGRDVVHPLLGVKLEFKVKEQTHILNNWNEFIHWFEEVCADDYQYNDKYIEGFVFEDTTGFMCKTKTAYYKMWKLLRSVAKDTLTCGYFSKTGALQNITMNQFYGWVKNKFKTFDKNTDIITLRNIFETESRTS